MGQTSRNRLPTAPFSAPIDSGRVVSERRAGVFFEHNLVSVLILAAAVAGALFVISKLASPGTWRPWMTRAASQAISGE
jgi:hypothetical protein